ncbi:MAG: hypothetical protein C0392_14875 [Syntrophus sp. (in: bacteria)]|nr:hypothetical protein [Syntrophus sp. (in: bacteria)]
MTSYNVDTIQCPGCGGTLATWGVASCNTIDAKLFTDGFVDGPMYDHGGALLTCPKCDATFWRKDISAIRSVRHGDADSRALPIAHTIAIAAYPVLLLKAPWRTEEEEKYVRIRAWWAWNEEDRYIAPWWPWNQAGRLDTGSYEMPEIAHANLERLLELLNDADTDEVITRGEILRELGRFQECLALLVRSFDNRYNEAVRVITALAREGKRCVSPI